MLAARFTNSHSSLDFWSFLSMSGHTRDSDRVYVYGDKGFYLEECVIGAFRASASAELSEDQEIFNEYMTRERMAVEWGFEKVTSLFSFNKLPVNFKYGLSPIASYYFTSVLLTNCHTCYNGSKTSITFECNPATVRRYLGFEGNQEDQRVSVVFLPRRIECFTVQQRTGYRTCERRLLTTAITTMPPKKRSKRGAAATHTAAPTAPQ
jgi:hypothetical protein